LGPDEILFERKLANGPSNPQALELHLDTKTGKTVLAKRFQLDDGGHAAFHEIIMTLKVAGPGKTCLTGVCPCLGAYRDGSGAALLLSEYVAHGDLFDLSASLGEPGPDRERKVWPVALALLSAVDELHSVGVAHGDISAENVLWRPGSDDIRGEALLIDFAIAVTGDLRAVPWRGGKASYQAPEMHVRRLFDARAADAFACGVVVYLLAMGAYPWMSTRPGVSRTFDFASKHGLQALFRKRCVKGGDGRISVAECLSPRMQALLLALLDFEPQRRLSATDILRQTKGQMR
jgi:serine/threonine protein kinase